MTINEPSPVPATDSQKLQAHAARTRNRTSNNFMLAGAALGVLGILLLIVGASSTDAYGVHHGPTAGSLLIFVAAVVLVMIGFAKRLLSAIEHRNR